MPKLNGKEVISLATERTGRALLTLSAAVVIAGISGLNLKQLEQFEVFGVELPAEISWYGAVFGITYLSIKLIYVWLLDWNNFRNWFDKNQIRMEAGTLQEADINFVTLGLLDLLDFMEKHKKAELNKKLNEEHVVDFRQGVHNFNANAKLYLNRLDSCKTDMRLLTNSNKIYVIVFPFVIPVLTALCALTLLLSKG